MLRIVHPVCCGIDVHKKFVVATIATTDEKNVTTYQKKRFTTHFHDLEKLKNWLLANNCIEICMESTGKYWIPVHNILETACNVTVANPKYVRAIPGDKTDDKDSAWISDLFKHGLVPGSYIPEVRIRKLRELTRYRVKLIGGRTGERNRINNSLTVSNITLDSVISDMFGKTGSAILNYLLTCKVFHIEECKKLINPKIKASHEEIIESVIGYKISFDQATKIGVANEHLASIEKCLTTLDASINELASPFSQQLERLMTIPGIKEHSAIAIISEIGVDMSIFPTSKKLCSWAGLTPQNNESAGKKKSTKISRAGVYIKPLLVQCANAALKSKNPYFKNKYDAIKKRRGHKKAIIAIARMMLTSIYHMLKNNTCFAPTDLRNVELTESQKQEFKQKQIDSAIALLQKSGYVVAMPA